MNRSLVLGSVLLFATIAGCAVGVSPSSDDVATEQDADAAVGPETSSITNGKKGDASAQAVEDAGAVSDPVDAGKVTDAGSPKDASAKDASTVKDSGSTAACPGYALPSDSASCNACQQSSSTCQPNGCYGGYYCELSGSKCRAKPSGC